MERMDLQEKRGFKLYLKEGTDEAHAVVLSTGHRAAVRDS